MRGLASYVLFLPHFHMLMKKCYEALRLQDLSVFFCGAVRVQSQHTNHIMGFDWNFKCVTYCRHDELQHLLVHRQKHWGRYNDACRELGCWEWSWEDANKHSRDALERARVEIERWRFALQKLLIRSNRYLKTKRPVMCCLIDWAWPSFNSPFTTQKMCSCFVTSAFANTKI